MLQIKMASAVLTKMVAYPAAYVGWVSFVWCADNLRCPSSMATIPNDLGNGMRIACCAHNLMPTFGQTCAKSRSGRNVSDCLLHLSWTKAKKSWAKKEKKNLGEEGEEGEEGKVGAFSKLSATVSRK